MYFNICAKYLNEKKNIKYRFMDIFQTKKLNMCKCTGLLLVAFKNLNLSSFV